MTSSCMVIVGGGQTGGRAAFALRAKGWTGRIVLIGAEAHHPYERPFLSKQLMLDASTPPTLVAEQSRYAHDGIELRLNTRAVSLDLATKKLALVTGGGALEALHYSKLLLATGGRSRTLDIPGSASPHVVTLRTLNDAAQLSARLRTDERIVIVGGGFIGLELAASAHQVGCHVTVLEMGPRVLGRAVPPELAAKVHTLHTQHGVDIRLKDGPTAFGDHTDTIKVLLRSGGSIQANTVVIGVGMAPETSLARGAGLKVNQGILVNKHLQTSNPDVFAAGDCAEFPGTHPATTQVMESWANAEAQAEVAAANLLGASVMYQLASWMWSDQFDHSLQMTGQCSGAFEVASRPIGEGQINFYLDAQGRVIGGAGFAPSASLARPFAIARRLVEMGATRTASVLTDSERTMKSLLAG